MDRLLSVSQASRMVGVPRKVLQFHIQEGRISTFEGYIRMSQLLKAFPEARADNSGMLEKVNRIRDAALYKGVAGPKDRADLEAELHRMKLQLGQMQEKIESYQQLAAETELRIKDLQENCDRRQAMLLGKLMGWFMHQVKLRNNS